MRIYLSGPITDTPHFERAFEQAASNLRSKGHEVISPVEMDNGDLAKAWGTYIGRDLEVIRTQHFDALVVLPGWSDSEGCACEVALAKQREIPVLGWPLMAPPAAEAAENLITPDFKRKFWRKESDVPVDTAESVQADAEHEPGSVIEFQEGVDPTPMYPGTSKQSKGPLAKAMPLVHGDRQKHYGHPIEDFTRTAAIWNAIFGWNCNPADVPLAMIAVKLSRLRKTPDHEDSQTDIAGYIETYSMVKEKEAESFEEWAKGMEDRVIKNAS